MRQVVCHRETVADKQDTNGTFFELFLDELLLLGDRCLFELMLEKLAALDGAGLEVLLDLFLIRRLIEPLHLLGGGAVVAEKLAQQFLLLRVEQLLLDQE
jgi:hypothetical protein